MKRAHINTATPKYTALFEHARACGLTDKTAHAWAVKAMAPDETPPVDHTLPLFGQRQLSASRANQSSAISNH